MSFRVRLCLSLLALLLAFAATSALGTQDPELKQCRHQCRAQQQFGKEKRELCVQRCEDYYREKHGGGATSQGEEEEVFWDRESPIERLRECSRRCQQQHGEQTQECQKQCQQQYEREKEQYEGGRGGGGGRVDDNPTDPQREFQQCRERCSRQAKHGGSTQECEQLCEDRRREWEHRHGGGGRGSDNPTNPQREYQQCRDRCRRQAQHGGSTQECEQRCEERRRESERHHGGGGRGSDDNPTDPQKEYQQCRDRCRRQAQHGGSSQECEQRCEERRREREQGRDLYDSSEEMYEGRERGEEREEAFQGQNPYVFEDRHFRTGMQTQHGRVRILQKFTDRSKLLKGIENYRLTILEMEPQTFVVPNHWDAEAVFFVANGI